MIKKIALAIGIVLVAFAIVVALQPADYTVTRSAVIDAPPETIFSQVQDFHKWEAWSPWAKIDPGMKTTFEGPPSGVGAIYTWSGNKDVGEGRMTLLEARSNELVRIKLEFIKPFASTCSTDFALKPQGKSTAVTWSMAGQNGFVEKAFSLMMSMDKMIGSDFEKGLAQLKSVAEKKP